MERFCALNGDLCKIEAERDARSGVMLAVDIGVFVFLLLGPIVSMIPKMRGPWVVAIELTLVISIALWCVEFGARRVVWFTCCARGVILTFDKTHTIRAWATQKPMFLAYAFLFVHAFVNYLGLDPTFTRGDLADVLTAVLSILAVLFVLLMTKNLIDIEGANSLLTVNMFLFFFDDAVLRERGFHVTSFLYVVCIHGSTTDRYLYSRWMAETLMKDPVELSPPQTSLIDEHKAIIQQTCCQACLNSSQPSWHHFFLHMSLLYSDRDKNLLAS